MKKIILILLILGICLLSTDAFAVVLFDNFNDGNTDGWMFIKHDPRTGPGIWSVEDGVLIQRNTGDNYVALVEDLVIADQSIETQVKTYGYGGVVLWYQDGNHFVAVSANPFSAGLSLYEPNIGELRYLFRTEPDTWYDLRIDADSQAGALDIFVDNSYIFTYNVSTLNRVGLSGVHSGNAIGSFDNFKLTYATTAIPEPSTLFLLGAGLLGLVFRRKK